MLPLILLGVFLSAMLVVLAIGFASGSRRRQALRRAIRASRELNPQAFGGVGGLAAKALRALSRPFLFLFPDSDALRLRLVRAGYNTRTAPLTYSSVRVMLLAGLPAFGFAMGMAVDGSLRDGLAAAAFGLLLAAIAPPYALRRQMRARALRMRRNLPDALDLMVVCVEAGLGLDAAIVKVSEEFETSHPEIAHEFRVVNHLVNAGMPRSDALREMAERTGVPQISSLVGTLIQSERLGTSIARTLRVYAEQLRTRRRQKAEEAAAKAPIKMLLPMVLFVLPALFVVVMGPAIIVLYRTITSLTP